MRMRSILAYTAGALGALALAGSALADTAQSKALVDAAKTRGVVGEKSDGYLGFVASDADAALRAAVAEINAGRAQVYREAAAKNGVTPAAAGAAAFQQVVRSRLDRGEYYQDASGAWVRK
jgi:uncharacterized protein